MIHFVQIIDSVISNMKQIQNIFVTFENKFQGKYQKVIYFEKHNN